MADSCVILSVIKRGPAALVVCQSSHGSSFVAATASAAGVVTTRGYRAGVAALVVTTLVVTTLGAAALVRVSVRVNVPVPVVTFGSSNLRLGLVRPAELDILLQLLAGEVAS